MYFINVNYRTTVESHFFGSLVFRFAIWMYFFLTQESTNCTVCFSYKKVIGKSTSMSLSLAMTFFISYTTVLAAHLIDPVLSLACDRFPSAKH